MMRRFTPLAGIILALALFAGSHQLAARAATNWPATCATLQAVLNAPTTLAGDTVTLSNAGVPCTAPTITYPVALPNKQLTIAGATSSDGFNGQGAAQLMTGTNVGATVITNLTFENGHVSGYGAAILVDGSQNLTISKCKFLGNSATGTGAVDIGTGNGGTLTMTGNTFGGTAAGAPNTSSGQYPGAVWIDSNNDVVMSNNSFIDNKSNGGNNGDGGAGAVFVISRTSGANITLSGNTVSGNSETVAGGIGGGVTLEGKNLTVTGNSFTGNSIGSGSSGGMGNFGGGLAVINTATGATLNQSHNLFTNNHIGSFSYTGARAEAYFGGGGEFVQMKTISSFDDTFMGNTVDGGVGLSTSVGGGLGLEGNGSGGTTATLTAANLVATGNSVQTSADGEANGGGIYAGFGAGCFVSLCPAEVDLFNSTITGNSANNGPGMSGGVATDVGKVTNSIVYGNTGNAAQISFGSLTVTSSDSCSAAATAYTGSGNICADPKLVDPAAGDVHESASSPTVNAGNNSLIPAGLTTDYYGAARVSGGTVDIGAAEFQSVTTTPPVPAAGAASGTAVPAGIGLLLFGGAVLAILGCGVALRRRRSTEP